MSQEFLILTNLIYVTGSGKRDISRIFSKSSYWHCRVEQTLSYKMHHSFCRQSNALRSYGSECPLIFVYSKKYQFEKMLIEVLFLVLRQFFVILKMFSGYVS